MRVNPLHISYRWSPIGLDANFLNCRTKKNNGGWIYIYVFKVLFLNKYFLFHTGIQYIRVFFCRISQNVPKLNILRFKSNCKKAKIRSFRKILDIRYLNIGTQTQLLKKDRAFHIHAYIKLY